MTTIQRPLRVPHGPFSENDAKSLASLYTGAKSNLRDRVSGEVEKGSFIALPGKGRHRGLRHSKPCVPNLGKILRSFILIVQRGHGHSPGGLMVRSLGVSIISLYVQLVWGLRASGQPYHH